MPLDWDLFENDLSSAIDASEKKTDEKLSNRISSISRLTDEEVSELFPEPADLAKLTKLMRIVKSADDHNSKVNQIVDNTEEFAGIIVKLFEKFL